MADPQQPDRLQQLADPSQASVFDSFGEQLQRRIAQAMLSGELAQSALGSSPAIARVPKEATEALVARLLASYQDASRAASGAPTALQEAIQLLAARFPRMLSHIERVRALPGEFSGGASGLFHAYEDGVPRVGEIAVDPGLNPRQMLDTLTHELTHGGQALRAADRGLEFKPAYSAQRQQYGYYNSPMEYRARVAENNQHLRRTGDMPDTRARIDLAQWWAGKMGQK